MTTLSNQFQSYKAIFLIIEVLWATKALLLPSFCLAFPSLNPPTPALVSMATTMTSFHTHSYWPPSGVIINENGYFM